MLLQVGGLALGYGLASGSEPALGLKLASGFDEVENAC